MNGEENPSKERLKKKNKMKNFKRVRSNFANDGPDNNKNTHRNPRRGRFGWGKDLSQNPSSRIPNKGMNAQKSSKQPDSSKQTSILRKRVDPETAKYFAEITNLFEGNEVDLEERATICGNALEETRGKEVELATDMIISRTLQCLLEGCDLDQLCGFLQNCTEGFPSIATDKFGSHVVETALKSLAIHLQNEGSYSIIEVTLTKLCEVVVVNVVNLMCSRYGSHVIRRILCLCKGVPIDSLEEYHSTKPSAVLAQRLNFKPSQSSGNNSKDLQHSFPVVFKFLTQELFRRAKDDISTLRVNNYSSFVFQTALKLLVGDDDELPQAIFILLGCQEKFIETAAKQEIMALLEDTASSHLLEVIVEVAPEYLYNELLNEVFKGSLFESSSHQCGNFVMQALVSSARTRDQVKLMWMELGPKVKELFEVGKSGVVASIVAACLRLQTHFHEVCQALAAAVSLKPEASGCIVPHILFLESYFRDKTRWKWPKDEKMHTLGCLILQTIFKYPSHVLGPYTSSITSMEPDQMYQTAKDAGGGRVLEAFLCSDLSAKQKFKIITKLQDHYGELSMHPSSSFTVEKCFTASHLPLKEAIAAELVPMQSELSKTKHGPYLLKKLDIDGFARSPQQWRQSRAAKEAAYKEFGAIFGPNRKHHEQSAETQSPQKTLKKCQIQLKKGDNIECGNLDACNATGPPPSGAKSGFLSHKLGPKRGGKPVDKNYSGNKYIGGYQSTSILSKSGKRKPSASDELADLAGKKNLTAVDVRKLFTSTVSEFGRAEKEKMPFHKKQKM